MKKTLWSICPVLAALLLCANLQPVAVARAEAVVCDEATITVKASNMKAEDLITAIGNACSIRMVLRGELFTEDVFSVQFEKMPVRDGLERVLRIVNIPNHMMHFSETDGRRSVVEITLIGTKGGERQLTSGASLTALNPQDRRTRQKKQIPPQPTEPAQAPPPEVPEKTEAEEDEEEELAEALIDLLDDILDKHFDDEDDPDPAAVMEMFHQALPKEMHGRIPPEVMEEIEWILED